MNDPITPMRNKTDSLRQCVTIQLQKRSSVQSGRVIPSHIVEIQVSPRDFNRHNCNTVHHQQLLRKQMEHLPCQMQPLSTQKGPASQLSHDSDPYCQALCTLWSYAAE
eukprot:1185315-Prorocentrum_minimum.AAC.1